MAGQIWDNDLSDLSKLAIQARSAEVVTWHGQRALQLDGLALVPDLQMLDGSIEVQIGADGACYAGVAWGVSDVLNYELAYAVPHCSGIWDAIQYDPVFHGSNTWQLYHGPAYQQSALVPTGEWFCLRIDVHAGRAAIQVNDEPPLRVEQLVYPHLPGHVGLWTYKPAFFRALRVTSNGHLPHAASPPPGLPAGVLRAWFVDGFGRMSCEPNGMLNLNRRLPLAVGEVRLLRSFDLAGPAELELDFGFSDELSLAVDGTERFSGSNTFKGFGGYDERGYAHLGAHTLRLPLERGRHRLAAKLRVTEGFGWGMILKATAEGLRWLAATSNAQ